MLRIDLPAGPCPAPADPFQNKVAGAQTGFILHGEFDVQVDFSVSPDFHQGSFAAANAKLFIVDEDGDALESSMRSTGYVSLELLNDGTLPFERITPTADLDGRFRIVRTERIETISVAIDIKPGTYTNSINLGSRGVVPVAILTTDVFDAVDVDPATVLFAGASPLRWVAKDVDSDGDIDLLFHFKTQDLQLDRSSTEALLTGTTFGGQRVEGGDTVRIVP